MFSRSAQTDLALGPGTSPSYQWCNLSANSTGRLAFVHLNEIYLVGSDHDAVILPIQNRVVIHQVAFGSLLGVDVLVIATSSGVQFW